MNLATILMLGLAAAGQTPTEVEVHSAVLRAIDRVDVPATEFGTLTDVAIRPGDRVAKGDVLLQIGDEEVRLELDKVKLQHQVAREQATDDVDLRFARKSLEVQQAELRRVVLALERLPGSISEAELDQMRLNVERAQLAIEQAELNLKLSRLEADVLDQEVRIAERKVERRRIVSPIDGTVMEVGRHIGEWVEPGETVVRVVGLDRLRAEGFVDVKHAQLLRTEAAATFTLRTAEGRSQPYPARVTFVGQEVDPVNGQILVWAEIDNSRGELKSGLPGRLTISTK